MLEAPKRAAAPLVKLISVLQGISHSRRPWWPPNYRFAEDLCPLTALTGLTSLGLAHMGIEEAALDAVRQESPLLCFALHAL